MKLDNKSSFKTRVLLNYNMNLDSKEDKYTQNVKNFYYFYL